MRIRNLFQLLIIICLAGYGYSGDLRVNIFNGTLNLPGTADRVALVDLTAGMAEIASASNVVKSATFSDISASRESQYLVRATLDGVNYSAMFVPTAGVTAWETSLTIYNTEEVVHDVITSVPFFVIYGFEDKLYIQKRFILDNVSAPPVTFHKLPGLTPFHLPQDVTEIDYLTFKSGSMPLNTSPIDVENGQVLPNPIKPGVSEIDAAYYLPYDPAGTSISELVGYDIDHFHVYTMPIDLNISAPGLTREGTDSENGLAIYAFANVKAGTRLEFQVSGLGMPESGPSNQSQNTGKIVVEQRVEASVQYTIAGILIMAVLIALFVSVTQQNEDLKQDSIAMLKGQKADLLRAYATLSKSDSDGDEKDRVLYRLVSVYKTLDRIK